jgi:hypothetical protein
MYAPFKARVDNIVMFLGLGATVPLIQCFLPRFSRGLLKNFFHFLAGDFVHFFYSW